MGDRANVAVRGWSAEEPPVYLYTHWGGFELPEVVRRALDSPEGHGRWDDPSYLARIVFEHMVRDAFSLETGFGISTTPAGDAEYDLILLDPRNGLVYRFPRSTTAEGIREALTAESPPENAISFEDFVSAEARTWENLTDAVVGASP